MDGFQKFTHLGAHMSILIIQGAHSTCKGSTSSQNSNRWFSLKNSHMSVNAFYRFNRDSSWVSLHLFTGSIQIHHVWASFHFDTAGSRRRAHESPQFVIWVGGCHAMGARCSEAARFSSDARRCYPPRGVAYSPRLMLARSSGMRAAHDFIPGILVAAASGRRLSGSRRAGCSRPSMHPPESSRCLGLQLPRGLLSGAASKCSRHDESLLRRSP